MSHLFSDPEFWVAVAFVIFMAVLLKAAWGKITAGLDARAERIKTEIDEARRLREEAQALLATYQRKQREAMAEADDIVAAARDEATRLKAEAAKALEDTVTRRTQQAMDKIARAEAQALQDVRNAAADVAVAAAEKLIQSNLDSQKAQALVDQTIADVGRKLH